MMAPNPCQRFNPDRRRFVEGGAVGILGLLLPTWSPRSVHAASESDSARQKKLIVHSPSPLNAEPALEHLIQSWITPVEHFYVRNHAPTPELDIDTFRVSVEGMVEKPRHFSVAELQRRFPPVTAVATMTCAGNRRNEHHRVKKVDGVLWNAGPIGNAQWSGIALSDLLAFAGVKGDARHVWFESVDRIKKDDRIISFGGSIPLEKALARHGGVPEAIVAFTMNGKPLLPDHGFPVRMVVPGYIGARSVKWLRRIIVSKGPSPNYYLANAYKIVTKGTAQEWVSAPPVYRYPINAAICIPAANTRCKSGRVRVAGYALPAGVAGTAIARVELSADGGMSWTRARLHPETRDYCWRLWHADVQVDSSTTELVVRATDTARDVQPETVPWNLKGYLFNSWHRVPVRVS